MDLPFARSLSHGSLGVTAAAGMSDCEHYGMAYGCNEECPVLRAGECELQDSENKELYATAIELYGS